MNQQQVWLCDLVKQKEKRVLLLNLHVCCGLIVLYEVETFK